MIWGILIGIVLGILGLAAIIAYHCYDDEDADMDPWNSYE